MAEEAAAHLCWKERPTTGEQLHEPLVAGVEDEARPPRAAIVGRPLRY